MHERDDSVLGGWRRLENPFLNISVFYGSGGYSEQGFLATRFHPNYVNNGLLYSWYTVRGGIGEVSTLLAEFQVSYKGLSTTINNL